MDLFIKEVSDKVGALSNSASPDERCLWGSFRCEGCSAVHALAQLCLEPSD